MNAGKHVLLEKPFTANAEEARSLASLAAQKKLVLGGQHLLWTEQAGPSNLDSIVWPRAASAAEVRPYIHPPRAKGSKLTKFDLFGYFVGFLDRSRRQCKDGLATAPRHCLPLRPTWSQGYPTAA